MLLPSRLCTVLQIWAGQQSITANLQTLTAHQKSDIRTNSPCCSVLLWISVVFVFCRLINKNVSEWFLLICNMLWTNLQTFLVETIPHCFWLRKVDQQMPSTECYSYIMQLKKQPLEVFYKDLVLKNFVIFTGKYQCEILQENSFEEDLCMADSQLTL